jgi:hypothetical protein
MNVILGQPFQPFDEMLGQRFVILVEGVDGLNFKIGFFVGGTQNQALNFSFAEGNGDRLSALQRAREGISQSLRKGSFNSHPPESLRTHLNLE